MYLLYFQIFLFPHPNQPHYRDHRIWITGTTAFGTAEPETAEPETAEFQLGTPPPPFLLQTSPFRLQTSAPLGPPSSSSASVAVMVSGTALQN